MAFASQRPRRLRDPLVEEVVWSAPSPRYRIGRSLSTMSTADGAIPRAISGSKKLDFSGVGFGRGICLCIMGFRARARLSLLSSEQLGVVIRGVVGFGLVSLAPGQGRAILAPQAF